MLQQDIKFHDIFVGREYEIDQYERLIKRKETPWILHFIGIPGIGKSQLLRHLKEKTPDDVGIIHIDFRDTDPHLLIPTDILTSHSPMGEGGSGKGLLVEEFPYGLPVGITDPLQVLEALAFSVNDLCNKDRCKDRYREFANILQDARKKLNQPENQQNVQDIVEIAFYRQLDTIEKKQIVFMLDTCELLNEPGGWEVGRWLIGNLLPTLHKRMGQRCLVVIAGRVLLESAVLQEQDQLRIDLSMFKEKEINEYLELSMFGEKEINEYLELSMFEEKEINEYLKHITKMTYGHPLSLSIIRELWHQEGGKPLSNDPDSIAAFQLKFDKKVATDFVEERILKRLIPTPTLKKLTEYGALLRSFNRPQLGDVFSDLLPELKVDDVFDQFVSYPYIEFKGDYRYTFHEFVRERLARYTQEGHLKEWRAYHKKALDSFTPGVGIPEGAPYLPEWYYHLIGFNEIEGMKEWKEAIQKAKNSENNENRKSLLLIARDKALNLTLTSQLTCTEEEEQFYKDIGEHEKAVERHDHAEFLRMEIKRLREKARGLEARGDDQRQYGDLSVALESYKEALQLFQHIGNHSEGEDRLQNVIDEIEEEIKLLREKVVELGAKGRDQRERGDLGAALESYKEALQLLQRIGNHPVDEARLQHVITEIEKEIEYLIEKARELEARGDDRRPYGDLGAALESYKEALQLFQQVSNHAEDVARLQRAVDEIEQQLEALTTTTNDNETISSASIPDPTGIGALTNRKILHVPLSLLRRRPLLTASIFLLLIVLLFLLIFTPILQTIIPNHISFQPPPGIGITQSSNGQSIGISNGTYTFNSNCQTDNALKCQAAEKLRQGDINEAKSLWNRELATNANDAEALIYLEDQRVQNSPHITLVVATTLTGSPADLGQDNLQGAYIAQKEFNDGFKLPHGLKVFLLIANFGSNPKDATTVAKQIVQAAQADKTIVGVMGLPLGSYVPDAIAVLQQAQLPLVSPTASGDGLTGISPFFFRIVPPDQVQASVGANYAVQALHAHTVAIFYDPQDSSNKGLAKGFERDFTDLGGIARENTYTTGQPETLRSQLQDMSGNLPDLLYFAGSATDMNTVLVNLPPSSNLQIMGGDSLYQLQDYSTIPRSALTHLYFTAFAYPDEWNNLCSNGLSQVCFQPSFFASYSQSFNYGRHQEQPYGYGRANSDTIVSYDALSVLLTAYQRLSQGQTLQVALKELTGDQAFQGVSGQISFGTDGNPLNKAVVLLSLRPDGDVQLASTSGIQGCFLINTCTNP